ncbi:hypothetical protein [Micromonospora sp. NPDC049301]|uniref:hypothetical protein n=1 Tax=Micromonospora sp. NPDC049301 TaxID=3155723 RepID=UPI00342E8DED
MQPPAGSQVSRVPAQRTPSEQLPPAPPAPAPQRPRRRARTVLTVVGGVLALLILGAAATAYVLYDRASTPDRSAPDVVVASYIQAFLVDRNDVRADQFTCEGVAKLEQLRALRDDLVAREERFGVSISVSWGPLDVQAEGNRAVVQVELIISAIVDGITQSDRQLWSFVAQRGADWRLCDGARVGR